MKNYCWLKTGITANITIELANSPKVNTTNLCISFVTKKIYLNFDNSRVTYSVYEI